MKKFLPAILATSVILGGVALSRSAEITKAVSGDLGLDDEVVVDVNLDGLATTDDVTAATNALNIAGVIAPINERIDDIEVDVANIGASLENKADKSYVDNTFQPKGDYATVQQLNSKANQSDLDAVEGQLEGKADDSDVSNLQSQVNLKANQSDFISVSNELNSVAAELDTKADNSAVDFLESSITNLQTTKQDTLTAGASIDISDDNVISVYGDSVSFTATGATDSAAGKGYQGTLNNITKRSDGAVTLKTISMQRRANAGNYDSKVVYCRVLLNVNNAWVTVYQSTNSIALNSVGYSGWLGEWNMVPVSSERTTINGGDVIRIVFVTDTSVAANTNTDIGARTTQVYGGFIGTNNTQIYNNFAPMFKFGYTVGFATQTYVDEAVEGAIGEVDSALEEYATIEYLDNTIHTNKVHTLYDVDSESKGLYIGYFDTYPTYPSIVFFGFGIDKEWLFPSSEHNNVQFVASQDWVEDRGYATQSWVQGLGYLTSSALTPYMTKAFWNEQGVTSNDTIIHRSNDAYTAAYLQDAISVKKNPNVQVAGQESGGASRSIIVHADDSTSSAVKLKARLDESISNTGVANFGATVYPSTGGATARMSASAVNSTTQAILSEVTSRANSTEATLSVAGASTSKVTVGKMTRPTSPNVTAQVENNLASVTLKDGTGELTLTPNSIKYGNDAENALRLSTMLVGNMNYGGLTFDPVRSIGPVTYYFPYTTIGVTNFVATQNWANNQGWLKSVPDNYATTDYVDKSIDDYKPVVLYDRYYTNNSERVTLDTYVNYIYPNVSVPLLQFFGYGYGQKLPRQWAIPIDGEEDGDGVSVPTFFASRNWVFNRGFATTGYVDNKKVKRLYDAESSTGSFALELFNDGDGGMLRTLDISEEGDEKSSAILKIPNNGGVIAVQSWVNNQGYLTDMKSYLLNEDTPMVNNVRKLDFTYVPNKGGPGGRDWISFALDGIAEYQNLAYTNRWNFISDSTEETISDNTVASRVWVNKQGFAKETEVSTIKDDIEVVEQDIAELKAPKQTLLRTGQWIATYEPATSSSVVTNTTSTTVDNRILESKEVVAKTDGKATMKAMPISEDAYEVKLVSAESVNGDAVVDGLNVSASTAGNYNPVIRVTAESGETKTCMVALSQSIETKKLGTVYTGDVAGTFRKKFNDVTLPYLASGEGDEYVERTAEGKTVYVGENSYFTTGGKAWNANCYLPSSLTSFICFKTSASSYAQGQQSTNTGGGPAFVIGKRLVAGASHWYASLNGVYTREIMRPNGTVVTVTTTGRGWNLAQWVKDNYGDAAEEVLGSLPTDYSDLDVYETTEDIPDDCVPYLLPFDVADDHFNVTNRTLEINYVNGYSLSQANCVYPVSMITDRGFSYGATNKCRKDIGDSWYKGHYWRVFQGDSSRPSFLIYNTSPIVVSLWSTYGHGPSLMRAVRALEALEQANGRTNSLKVLTAEQINTYISQ